jgi:hypothetical protein
MGKPYIWGGDDPAGFDCSGLVVECLRSAGAFPRGRDATADGLYRQHAPVNPEDVRSGDLVFWLAASRAVHVGLVIDPPDCYIGAEGGGSWATDPAAALRRNAYIQVNPIASRGLPSDRRFASPIYPDEV